MAEAIGLRMARAYPAQIQRMREWFQSLDELYHNVNVSDADIAIFVHAHYGDVENDWERILFGYETLIDNACDQSLSYLEFKPEIKAAITAYSGAGEDARLRQAAQEWIAYYDRYGAREFNRRFGTREVHGDDFIKFLREFLSVGEASKPADVGN